MKKAILIKLVFWLFPLAGFCPQGSEKQTKLDFMVKKAEFEKTIYHKEFSYELLQQAIYFQQIERPDIVLRQAMLESGNFTSDIFLNANNIFGIRRAKIRLTPAIDEYKGHAKYLHWYDSTRDYKYLQDYYKELGYKTDDYFLFLEQIPYATNPNYTTILKELV